MTCHNLPVTLQRDVDDMAVIHAAKLRERMAAQETATANLTRMLWWVIGLVGAQGAVSGINVVVTRRMVKAVKNGAADDA